MKAMMGAGILAAMLGAAPAHAGDLSVTLRGVEAKGGNLRVALYAKPETFKKEALAEAVLSQPARTGEMVFTFPAVAPGTYAVVAYHDANVNGKMDLILGMFPDEGWGLSNDPDVIGPPPFADSAFTVGEGPTDIAITLSY